MLGLRFCARASSSCGKRGPLLIAVRGPLTIAASLVAEHRLQTHRLSSCGSWARLLCGMWDPPRPGLKPLSPALAGRLSTTPPPGKPFHFVFERPWWSDISGMCALSSTFSVSHLSVSGSRFLWIYPFGVCWASIIYRFMSFAKCESFRPLCLRFLRHKC